MTKPKRSMRDAVSEAVGSQHANLMHGIAPDVDEFLEDLFKQWFIVVRNTEPSEYGFACHVCGCEYGGHEEDRSE